MAATLTLIPNFARVVTDASAGTVTIQTYDTTTATWTTVWTLTQGTGDETLAATLTAAGINPTTTVQSQAGETAGTIYWVMPFQGSGYKRVLVYLDAYENDTTTANVITFPTAFTYTPNVTNPQAVPGVTVSTTALSIDPDNTTTYTGWILVDGF